MQLPTVAHVRARNGKNEIQPLEEHLLQVAVLAGILAAKIGCPLAGRLQGLSHDLGKYRILFRRYLLSAAGVLHHGNNDYIDPTPLKGKIDHATAGAQLVWRRLSNGDARARAAAEIIALNIASHHGGMIDCIESSASKRAINRFAKRMKKAEEDVQLTEVLDLADNDILLEIHALIATPALVDEVVSVLEQILRRNPAPYTSYVQFGLLTRFLFSCLVAADRTDTAAFERGQSYSSRPLADYESWAVLVERFEQHLDGIKLDPQTQFINQLRKDISESCKQAASKLGPGVYSLTVPTAGGKTLASLRFALHHAKARGLDRVIYVIPYTSIIDQNAKVARKVLETDDKRHDQSPVVLEHHSNLAPEEQTELEVNLTQDWDAPVVFTTMVQFLESLFSGGTRGARRMHQLARAVIVFDEIQTLPIRCVHLFNNAINFLAEQCGSTILLCTATQPLLGEVSSERGAARLAADAEIVPDFGRFFDQLQRVRVHIGRKERDYEEIARLAIRQMQRQGSCLVIVNTRESAKRLFELCKEFVPKACLFHLSANMCPAHRSELIGIDDNEAEADTKTIIGRLKLGKPTLCISTQLVEAGINVDFKSVIRFLAGIDSIAQAAGRCNRHARMRGHDGKPARGRVFVVRCSTEKLGQLEEIRKGQDIALRVIDEFAEDPSRFNYDIIGPEAIRLYYMYYFFARSDEMVYKLQPAQARELGRHSETLLNLLSLNSEAAVDLGSESSKMFLKQSFKTAGNVFEAIEAPTEGVVVPYGEAGQLLIKHLQRAANDPKTFAGLARQAQRFSVNVYPQFLERLTQTGAVTELSDSARIRIITNREVYDSDLGLQTERTSYGWVV